LVNQPIFQLIQYRHSFILPQLLDLVKRKFLFTDFSLNLIQILIMAKASPARLGSLALVWSNFLLLCAKQASSFIFSGGAKLS